MAPTPPEPMAVVRLWDSQDRLLHAASVGVDRRPTRTSVTTETISVPEIHCEHCRTSIEGGLAPLDGVSRARVDIDARQVTVDYDAATVDRAALVRAIEDQGYDVPS